MSRHSCWWCGATSGLKPSERRDANGSTPQDMECADKSACASRARARAAEKRTQDEQDKPHRLGRDVIRKG